MADRRAAREAVATYHEAQLAGLLEHAGSAIDQFRRGQVDASGADQALFHYSRAAKELWKFCNVDDPGLVAGLIRDRPPADWWERGAPTQR